MNIFDPDKQWLAWDKAQHFIGGVIIAGVASLMLSDIQTLLVTVAIAIAFEVGQWDIARNCPICHINNDITKPFMPGFGIGLLDIAAGTLGAIFLLVIKAIA